MIVGTVTSWPACTASRDSTCRGLVAVGAMEWPFTHASSGPRTLISMLIPPSPPASARDVVRRLARVLFGRAGSVVPPRPVPKSPQQFGANRTGQRVGGHLAERADRPPHLVQIGL